MPVHPNSLAALKLARPIKHLFDPETKSRIGSVYRWNTGDEETFIENEPESSNLTPPSNFNPDLPFD